MKLFISTLIFSISIFSNATLAKSIPAKYKNFIYDRDLKSEAVLQESKAQEFEPSRDLEFKVDKTVVEANRILLTGTLTNTGVATELVYLLPVEGKFPFQATILESGSLKVKKTSSPGDARPIATPVLLKVPERSKVKFEFAIDLNGYDYKASSTAEVIWTFEYASGSKPTGRVPVKLPLK